MTSQFWRRLFSSCRIDSGQSTAWPGFVLVEVLVVTIIVGILAAVAIPIYTGYLSDQKKKVAKGIAESGAAAGNIYYRRTGVDPTPSKLNIFLTDSSKYMIQVIDRYIVVSDTTETPAIKDSAAFR